MHVGSDFSTNGYYAGQGAGSTLANSQGNDLPVDKKLEFKPFSRVHKPLGSRIVEVFDPFYSPHVPKLEKPDTGVTDLMAGFEVIDEYPVLDHVAQSSGGLVGWLKNIASLLVSATGGRVNHPEIKEDLNPLIGLLPSGCEQVVAEDLSVLSTSLQSASRAASDSDPLPQRLYQQHQESSASEAPALILPEQIWRKEPEEDPVLTGDQEILAEELEAWALREEKPVVLNVHTGAPIEDLDKQVWEFLVGAADILKPAGQKVKGAATTVISEEKVAKLQALLKDVLKDRVGFEVNKNLGRRLLQVAAICGNASPLIPALTLLGYSIPGVQLVPALLMLWRMKDFKDELSQLYYEKNPVPGAVDLAMCWGPSLIARMFGC
jgi:hypothetical protein